MDALAIGLRELRQQASELVRRAEAGAVVTVTVNGRPSARLVPPGGEHWRRLVDVAGLFAGPAIGVEQWHSDMEEIDDEWRDPGERP